MARSYLELLAGGDAATQAYTEFAGGVKIPTNTPAPKVDLDSQQHLMNAETLRQQALLDKQEAARAAERDAIIADLRADEEAMKLPADLRTEYFVKKAMAKADADKATALKNAEASLAAASYGGFNIR